MVRRLLWYPIALLWLAACSEGRQPCIHTTIRSRLISGSITYAFGSGAPETHTLSPAEAPVTLPTESGACAASTPQTDAWPDGYESGGGMMVGCEPTEGSVRIIVGPVQPRLLALDQPNELSTYGASITGAGCSSYCAQVVVTANVTRAQGGAAPHPSAVTADYLREVSVHIEFNGGFATTTASGRLCVAPSGSADLVFVETAADAVQTECAYASLRPGRDDAIDQKLSSTGVPTSGMGSSSLTTTSTACRTSSKWAWSFGVPVRSALPATTASTMPTSRRGSFNDPPPDRCC